MERHMSKQATVVKVTLLDRSDGGLHVYSETLSELILSGPNKHAVCGCIEPAIKMIFADRGRTVTAITPSESIASVMKQPSPRNMDVQVEHQFLVEFQDAA